MDDPGRHVGVKAAGVAGLDLAMDPSRGSQRQMRVALAVNPTSGRAKGADHAVQVTMALTAAGVRVHDVSGSDAASTAQRAARAAQDGVDAVVVVGGDGMVHLGANVCAGTGVPLGIVAAGTGNDIAASLGLPVGDVPAATTTILDGLAGSVRWIDVARRTDLAPTDGPADERTDPASPPTGHQQAPVFVGVLCGGFDARVNERANGWRWPRGKLRYSLATARELPVFRPLDYHLELDGQAWRTDAMLVAVGNGTRYGGGMRITPDASLDDGLLDVLVVSRVSVPELLRVFPRVFRGTHLDHPAVTVRQAKRVRLSAPDVVAYADGERFGRLPVAIEVDSAALGVLVPRGGFGSPP
ncbi:MAG: diacylglycerol/lipid kinase family protein [Angustibacter sp.]